ncbi:MAG: hypothetical protein KGL39_34645 [Patescibacteria group bacterium]|nr:hypothetical protein [Patescibacteria group bacterium]
MTMLELINEQYRLLLENFFDNEQSFSTETVGAMNLTLTAIPAAGDTSATLTSTWAYASGVQKVTFTNQNSDYFDVQFTNGSASITWQEPLTGACTSVNISTTGFQSYRLPAGISKITDSTITVGQLKFVPARVATRQQWDNLNFLPYSSDIPNYYFIYGPYINFWPVPSTTGNKITFNYKTRVPDLSTAYVFNSAAGAQYDPSSQSAVNGVLCFDYQQGTITSAADDGVSITGTGTKWVTAQGASGGFGAPANIDLGQQTLALRINPPTGDGLWYPIQQFADDTHLTLASPIINSFALTGATYSIGQVPLMYKSEDFHEMLVYGALMLYFSTIVPDPNKYKQFDLEYKKREQKMSEYVGTKSIDYNLGSKPALLQPSAYPFYPGSVNSP